jgi:hypothetical protein
LGVTLQGHLNALLFLFFDLPQMLYYIASTSFIGGFSMAQKLDPAELVEFKELLMANSIQNNALAQLLIEKGIITSHER